ncbi:MAG: amidohydrolase [Candidatus Glassbacteria bacterium]|nr:amidohydrolase [Candidatus Glassbacteria bacterium]
MYYDCHSHLDDIDRYGGWSAEKLLQKMDACGIERAVISSVRGIYADNPDDLALANETVGRAVGRYPERLDGSVCVNPKFPEASLREIEAYIARGPFVMVGEMCQFLQGWDKTEPGLGPIIERAQALEVPLMVHSSTEEHAVEILELCLEYPAAKFIMAHLGGMNRLYENIPRLIAQPRDNLWIDTSGACAFFAGYLERLIGSLGAGRVLFGVDMPLIEPAPLVLRIENLLVGKEEKECIASANLLGLLPGKR